MHLHSPAAIRGTFTQRQANVFTKTPWPHWPAALLCLNPAGPAPVPGSEHLQVLHQPKLAGQPPQTPHFRWNSLGCFAAGLSFHCCPDLRAQNCLQGPPCSSETEMLRSPEWSSLLEMLLTHSTSSFSWGTSTAPSVCCFSFRARQPTQLLPSLQPSAGSQKDLREETARLDRAADGKSL